MTEKYKRYFNRMIAESVCDKLDSCDLCDNIFGLDRKCDCPKLAEVDLDEYKAFVAEFAEVFYNSVMRGKNLHFRDWQEINTTEIINFLTGETNV